jgi:hypothetical protein
LGNWKSDRFNWGVSASKMVEKLPTSATSLLTNLEIKDKDRILEMLINFYLFETVIFIKFMKV